MSLCSPQQNGGNVVFFSHRILLIIMMVCHIIPILHLMLFFNVIGTPVQCTDLGAGTSTLPQPSLNGTSSQLCMSFVFNPSSER